MKLTLAALALMAGGTLFADDLHRDYRDYAADQARLSQLQADVNRDQYQLREARERGDWYRARSIQNDLNRDRAALNALRRDMSHDRRDIHRDQWERGYGYR